MLLIRHTACAPQAIALTGSLAALHASKVTVLMVDATPMEEDGVRRMDLLSRHVLGRLTPLLSFIMLAKTETFMNVLYVLSCRLSQACGV